MSDIMDEAIIKAAEALNKAKVPLENRYFVDAEGYIHGPITISSSDYVPVTNKPSTVKVHKVE